MSGTPVATVEAFDYDDPEEGNNARLSYSLEQNVVEESSGKPIFKIDSSSGLISTSICCLDRENAEQYTIHVVATDGGGSKGKLF